MSVYDHMEFRHLKYLVAIAETGTFSAAADRVHVSQPALSEQIRALEEILKFQIFNRSNGNALTPKGMFLLNYARKTLQKRKDTIDTLMAHQGNSMAPLRFGFSSYIQKDLLGSITHIYRATFPDSEIQPEGGETEELLHRIRDHSIDTALVTLPVADAGLQIYVLDREPLLVCMKQSDSLAECHSVPLSELDGKLSLFIDKRHHPVAYAQLFRTLKGLGVTVRPCKPVTNMDQVQWIVREGLCYALLRASRPLLDGLVARPIDGFTLTIDSALVALKDSQNPTLQLLIHELHRRCSIQSHAKAIQTGPSIGVRKATVQSGGRAKDRQLGLFIEQNSTGQENYRHNL